MDRFNRYHDCPKCGNSWIETHFHATGGLCGRDILGEHMHRKCSRCGYNWPEATLDAKP